MTNDNRENLNQEELIVNEEDTEINLPIAPDFVAAEPTPAQPVIPVAALGNDTINALPPQPQVVYVAQPTTVQARNNWSWVPVALALLLVATIAGVFIGAELYKRSIYAESTPTTTDVSPYAEEQATQNKSLKTTERSAFSGKIETSAPEIERSVSTTIAPLQRVETRPAREIYVSDTENNEEISQETTSSVNADRRNSETSNNVAKPSQQIAQDVDEADAPPPPKNQTREMPKKVENKKDTENLGSPQRETPNLNVDQE